MVRISQFFESDVGVELVLSGSDPSGLLEICRQHDPVRLVIWPDNAYPLKDLSFLGELPRLRFLRLWGDFRGTYLPFPPHPTLEELHANTDGTLPIDLAGLPRLKSLWARWSARHLRNMHAAPDLERLHLASLSGDSLEALGPLPALRILRMYPTRIGSLHAGGGLPSLRRLQIARFRGLATLDGVGSMPSLLALDLETGRCLTDARGATEALGLQRLALLDVGDLPDIEFVRELKELRHFVLGTTKITSGDMSPLKDLPKLTCGNFQRYRHYNAHRNEFPNHDCGGRSEWA